MTMFLELHLSLSYYESFTAMAVKQILCDFHKMHYPEVKLCLRYLLLISKTDKNLR
jgi:hypothetical protein